ncbi:hypothetical protein ASD74_23860 [Rhizobium sp. Root564]|nr:hypothetical protein ASD74_23860 [Rhizobium sp. Root564]
MTQPTILERVKEMTRYALEREAEKILALDVVKERISEAAKGGFNRLTVAPDKPLDLSQTTVAKATAAALRGEGFTMEWEVRLQPDSISYRVLIVNWA